MSNLYLNGSDVRDLFKARLIGYTVGPHSIGSPHYEAAASIIPVKVTETIGVRPITLELEFEGDSIEDTVLCISNATAAFLEWCDFKMPDGFYYRCLFDSAGSPVFKGAGFATCKFNFVGYRHLEQRTTIFNQSGEIVAVGNCNAPAIIKIWNASGDVTVNGITVTGITGIVTIDGYAKTVTEQSGDCSTTAVVGIAVAGNALVGTSSAAARSATARNIFARCNLMKFPYLVPGRNAIEITGDATVSVSYTPIFL